MKQIVFDAMLPTTLVLAIALLLFSLFVFLEWRKPLPFKLIRVFSLFALIASIIGIILRPSKIISSEPTYLLLTNDYKPSVVDSLTALQPNLRIIHSIGVSSHKNSTPIKSWHELSSLPIKFIHGRGVAAEAADILERRNFAFIPALPKKSTIIKINFPEEVTINKTAKFEFVYHNESSSPITFYLNGPSGKEDSTILTTQGQSKTTFTFIPKITGRLVYRLTSTQGHNEPVPVDIKPERKLNILLLQNYPTFESQNLKRFLGKKHSLLIRSQLSKSVYRYEYLNRSAKPFTKLGSDFLKDFDLLIIDSDALSSLSNSEENVLRNAVRDGLGAMILLNESPEKISALKRLTTFKFLASKSDTSHLRINNKTFQFSTWPVAVESHPANEMIIKNRSKALAVFQSSGFGKFGLHLLQQTYSLNLQGDTTAYGYYWSSLTEQIARRANQESQINIFTQTPKSDLPLKFEVLSPNKNVVVRYHDIIVPLRQHAFIPHRWTGKIWPEKSGWDSLSVVGDDTVKKSFFVMKDNEWSNLLETPQSSQDETHANLFEVREPVSPLIFIIALLISAAVLWFAPKW